MLPSPTHHLTERPPGAHSPGEGRRCCRWSTLLLWRLPRGAGVSSGLSEARRQGPVPHPAVPATPAGLLVLPTPVRLPQESDQRRPEPTGASCWAATGP
eukprot:14283424-Alexandrium_andersonii.AAC.1